MLKVACGVLLTATTSWGGNLCDEYQAIHSKDIVPRIRSGIPFKLLSVGSTPQGNFKRIIMVSFDLWTEAVSITELGRPAQSCQLSESMGKICSLLSIPELDGAKQGRFSIVLNPVMSAEVAKITSKSTSGKGLIKVDWDELVRSYQVEKILLEKDIAR
jgi:hypothetical protein